MNQSFMRKYQKLYVSYYFFNKEKIVKTNELVHQKKCIFKHKHIILLGLEDPQKIKDYLHHDRMVFEMHDKDVVIKDDIVEEKVYVVKEDTDIVEENNKDPKGKDMKGKAPPPKKEPPKAAPKKPDPKDKKAQAKKPGVEVKISEIEMPKVYKVDKSQLGRSEMFLKDLLNPYNLEFGLDAVIYPVQKFFDEERGNLELNENCRKKQKELVTSSLYLDEATCLKVKFSLAYPIGSFTNIREEPEQAAETPRELEEQDKPNPEVLESEYLRNSQCIASQVENLPYERVVFLINYKDIDL